MSKTFFVEGIPAIVLARSADIWILAQYHGPQNQNMARICGPGGEISLTVDEAVKLGNALRAAFGDGGKAERDALARAAMQGLCAALDGYSGSLVINEEMLADDAYAIADAMLKRRGKA